MWQIDDTHTADEDAEADATAADDNETRLQLLTFLGPTVPQIWGVSQNFKSRSFGPFPTPIDLILHFYSLLPLVMNLLAKFEV